MFDYGGKKSFVLFLFTFNSQLLNNEIKLIAKARQATEEDEEGKTVIRQTDS